MINTKDVRSSVNHLHHICDLIAQKDRQIDFWRDQARKQMSRNHRLYAKVEQLEGDIL